MIYSIDVERAVVLDGQVRAVHRLTHPEVEFAAVALLQSFAPVLAARVAAPEFEALGPGLEGGVDPDERERVAERLLEAVDLDVRADAVNHDGPGVGVFRGRFDERE